MKRNEAEMRMPYQIESTNQVSALNEIYGLIKKAVTP